MLTSTIALRKTTATPKAGAFQLREATTTKASLPFGITLGTCRARFVRERQRSSFSEPKQRVVVVLHQPVDAAFKPPNNPLGKGGRKV